MLLENKPSVLHVVFFIFLNNVIGRSNVKILSGVNTNLASFLILLLGQIGDS